jgi:hypothetical protein
MIRTLTFAAALLASTAAHAGIILDIGDTSDWRGENVTARLQPPVLPSAELQRFEWFLRPVDELVGRRITGFEYTVGTFSPSGAPESEDLFLLQGGDRIDPGRTVIDGTKITMVAEFGPIASCGPSLQSVCTGYTFLADFEVSPPDPDAPGPGPGPNPVPEPAGLALLGMLGALAWGRKK